MKRFTCGAAMTANTVLADHPYVCLKTHLKFLKGVVEKQ
jgi:hypothetical protein